MENLVNQIIRDFPIITHKIYSNLNSLVLSEEGLTKLCEFLSKEKIDNSLERKIVWAVTPLKGGKTFSSQDSLAPLHTDSAYLTCPENCVLLLCLRQAIIGGETIILTVDDIFKTLRNSLDINDEEINILSQNRFRWQRPVNFNSSLNYEFSEWGPILTNNFVKWKFSNINLKFSEDFSLIQKFNKIIENSSYRQIFKLNEGDLLVTNNYKVVHGRTAFLNQDRLLLRGRIIIKDSF